MAVPSSNTPSPFFEVPSAFQPPRFEELVSGALQEPMVEFMVLVRIFQYPINPNLKKGVIIIFVPRKFSIY